MEHLKYRFNRSSVRHHALFSFTKKCLNMNSTSVLGWFILSSVDHTCLLKVSLPLCAHHYSLTRADRWFHLAQLQVISCSLVCLLNVSGVLLRVLRTHFRALSFLTFIRTNGPPACCEYGEGKSMQSPSCGLSVSRDVHINQLLSSGCLYKTERKALKG